MGSENAVAAHRYHIQNIAIHGQAALLSAGCLHVPFIVPCCDCGWHGKEFHDDDDGRQSALGQWRREHLEKALTLG
jgi:hypothetical protein